MSKEAENINLTVPLPNVNGSIYGEFYNQIKLIKVQTANGTESEMNNETLNVFVNYTYLVYEYLELNKTRAIDYGEVRNFANRFKDYLAIILENYFSTNMLNVWLNDDVEIAEMAMYAPTNSYNKNVYH